MYAPIVLFVYNRIDHTKKTVEALSRCDLANQSILYIYSDGARPGDEANVAKVREYIHGIKGFQEVVIIERDRNYGIEATEIAALTEILNIHSSVIILEDDLVVAKSFLNYMNCALERYKSNKKVFYISGYSYLWKKNNKLPECMFTKMPSTWGWATWSDRWDFFQPVPCGVDEIVNDKWQIWKYKYDGANPDWAAMLIEQHKLTKYTWDVAWYVTVFNHDGLVLMPNQSLVLNIGLDGSGVHKEQRKGLQNNFENSDQGINIWPDKIEEIEKTRRSISKILKRQRQFEKYKNKIYHIKNKLYYFFGGN